MCGIVGYTGTREALPVLIHGLEQLEYRGYDSAGVACLKDSTSFFVAKEKQVSLDLKTKKSFSKVDVKLAAGDQWTVTGGVFNKALQNWILEIEH